MEPRRQRDGRVGEGEEGRGGKERGKEGMRREPSYFKMP